MKGLIPAWFQSQAVTGMIAGIATIIIGFQLFPEPRAWLAWICGTTVGVLLTVATPKLHKILMGGG